MAEPLDHTPPFKPKPVPKEVLEATPEAQKSYDRAREIARKLKEDG